MIRSERHHNLLERLLHDLSVVTEAASHHAAEDEVKRLGPRPLLLEIINLAVQCQRVPTSTRHRLPRTGRGRHTSK